MSIERLNHLPKPRVNRRLATCEHHALEALRREKADPSEQALGLCEPSLWAP